MQELEYSGLPADRPVRVGENILKASGRVQQYFLPGDRKLPSPRIWARRLTQSRIADHRWLVLRGCSGTRLQAWSFEIAAWWQGVFGARS